jgi:protein arginine kinase
VEPFLSELTSRVGSWLKGDGPQSDVVVSTRIRLARNVRAFPFAARMNEERSEELCELIQARLKDTPATRGLKFLPLKKTSDVCRDALLERFLISRELASSRFDRGVSFDDDESVSVMINEEDHLRLQSLRSGLDLQNAFDRMLTVDRALEETIEFAYSEDLGYLTSCPTNVGTGLRVSVMMHLPGLAMAQREVKKVFNVASRLNLAVRGLHGEGTQASGAFFQVSNQITLGRTERELLEDLGDVVPQIVDFERNVRTKLFESKSEEMDGRVDAAHELLTSGGAIPVEPAVSALSTLLLASSSGRYTKVGRADLLRWVVTLYPGHVQARAGRRLPAAELDRERGAYLRSEFARAAQATNGKDGGGKEGGREHGGKDNAKENGKESRKENGKQGKGGEGKSQS